VQWRKKKRSSSFCLHYFTNAKGRIQQDRLEREYRSNLREWEKYAEKTDADLVESNNRMDRHRTLLEDNLQWHRKAEEIAGRHEQRIENLERELENKSSYIEAVEIALAELSSKVDGMEGRLCKCGQVEPIQEEPPAKEEELDYTSETEYYTPPTALQLRIDGPIPIIPIGELEIHRVGFGTLEEVATSVAEGVLEEEESSEGEDIEEFVAPVG